MPPMTSTDFATTPHALVCDNWLEALPCDISRYIMDLTVITIDELVEQVYEGVIHTPLTYTVDEEELEDIQTDNQREYDIEYETSVHSFIKDLMSQQSQRALTLMFDKHFNSKNEAIDYINDEVYGYQDTLYEYDSPEGDSPFLYDYKMVALGIKVYERYLEVFKCCYDLDNMIKVYDSTEPDMFEYNLKTIVVRR